MGRNLTAGKMRGIPIDGQRLRELLLARGAFSLRKVAEEIGGTNPDCVSRAIRVNAIKIEYAGAIRDAYGIKLWEYDKNWRDSACMWRG